MRRILVYLDGAHLDEMAEWRDRVDGFTTNPTLMRKAGIQDYPTFGKKVLEVAGGKSVSLEVTADDPDEMIRQGLLIASWGENAVVKIPVVNSAGVPSGAVVSTLLSRGVKVNVTAVMTMRQVVDLQPFLAGPTPSIISVFAGRIADVGRNPSALVKLASQFVRRGVRVLWASSRQAYSLIEAQDAGADIITMSADLLRKTDLFGKDLEQHSIDTVRQFKQDSEGITL